MKPLVMGALMGAMMLWMAHMALTSESRLGGAALAAFVGAHLVIVALALAGGIWAARLSPRARGFLQRLHRPSLRHVAAMLGGAALSAGTIHLALHGVGA